MTSPIDIGALLDDPKPKRVKAPPPEPDLAERDPLWTWNHLVVLTAITLLAGILRLYRIGEWSFWIDEVHTLRDSVLKDYDLFQRSAVSRYPIGFLLLRWIEPLLPGWGEGSYRLPFAFCGICSVPMLAVLVRRIAGAGPALLAALLLAISPWHLYWSQNCRFYTVVLCFALAAMSAFYVGIEKGSRLWLVVSIVLAGLATLSHPSAVTILPSFVVFLVLLRTRWVEWPKRLDRRSLRWFLVPIGIGAVVFGWIVVQAFDRYQATGKTQTSIFHLFNTLVFFVRVPVIVTAIGGALLLAQRSRRASLFLVTMLIVPTLAVAGASLEVKATAQYLFFTLPIWCGLASYGVWDVVRRVQARGIQRLAVRSIVFGVLILDLASQDHLYFHYRNGDRPLWRQAAAYIERHGSPEDIIASTNEPSMEWYLNTEHPLRRRKSLTGKPRKVVEVLAPWTHELLEKWRRTAEKKRRSLWVVVEDPTLHLNDPSGRWDRWLREHCRQVLRLPLWTGPKDMTILVYRFEPEEKKETKPPARREGG